MDACEWRNVQALSTWKTDGTAQLESVMVFLSLSTAADKGAVCAWFFMTAAMVTACPGSYTQAKYSSAVCIACGRRYNVWELTRK